MATIEERVASLEGWKDALSLDIQDLKDRMLRLEERIDHVDRKIDQRFLEINNRITALDQKVDRFREEWHAEIVNVRQELSKKVDSYFRWTVGMFFAILLGLLGILLRGG